MSPPLPTGLEQSSGPSTEFATDKAARQAAAFPLAQEFRAIVGNALGFAETVIEDSGIDAMLQALHPANPLLIPADQGNISPHIGETINTDAMATHDKLIDASRIEWSNKQWFGVFGDLSADIFAESEQSEDKIWENALSFLKKGPPRMLKLFDKDFMDRYKDDADTHLLEHMSQYYQTMLPYALVRLADLALPDTVDKAQVLAGEFERMKTAPAKTKPESQTIAFDTPTRQQIYVRSISMVRQFYFAGQNPDFCARLATQGMAFRTEYETPPSASRQYATPADDTQAFERARSATIEAGNTVSANPALVSRGVDTFQGRRERALRALMPRRLSAIETNTWLASEAGRDAVLQTYTNLIEKRPAFIFEMQRTLIARNLVDGIASGSFEAIELAIAEDLANEQPLNEYGDEDQEIEIQFVDWEILRSAKGEPAPEREYERTAREQFSLTDAPETDEDREDAERRAWLGQFINQWGDGLIVRSKIPNLPKRRQYYVALLPEVVGDVTYWHGIGENKRGRHAVYMWRADQNDISWTWEDVYSANKTDAQALGAHRIYHTKKGLEDRVLEYLTRKKDLIQRRNIGAIAIRRKTEQLPETNIFE